MDTATTPGTLVTDTLVTTTQYDSNGYPITITRPDGSVIHQTFSAVGDLLTTQVSKTGEPNTYPITYTYDNKRQLLSTTDSLGFSFTQIFDGVGNMIAATDRFGNTSSATFSPLARIETATGSDNETTRFEYDASGRSAQVTDALNQISTATYDKAGRIVQSTNPANETVENTYDSAGNQTALTNARNNTYTWIFNANNLPLSLTTPLGYETSFTYDNRLLLNTVEEPSGQLSTMTYQADGQLDQVIDPTGTIGYDYDAKGRLQTVTEGAASLTREYDALDRVIGFTDSSGNTIAYDYDAADNLTALTYPGSKGTVTYRYDNAGRLTQVTDWASRATHYYYDSHSRLQSIEFPNGTERVYFYDFAGRVEQQLDRDSATQTIIMSQSYTYDELGRIIEEFITPEPAPYSIPPTLMSYDIDDRISSWQSSAITINPIFDDDGNMTFGPLQGVAETLVYDSRNRLTQAGAVTYAYDAEDRRIAKTDNGVSTTYIHDPHAPFSCLLQKTTGGDDTFYVYAGDQLLYEEHNGTIKVYHFDKRGSTRVMTDNVGNILTRITYGTYGEIVNVTSPIDTPFLFNGAYGVQTDENGLLFMRARYYSTETRRFLNQDPIGFDGGMNWYAYANGNPVMYTDPSGHLAWFLAVPIIYIASTQTLNAPSPTDKTSNDTPLIEVGAFAVGAGPAVATSRAVTGAVAAGGRSLMTTLAGPATNTTVRAAGTMSFEQATVATGALANVASKATVSAAQQFGAKALTWYGKYAVGSGGLGFMVGSQLDLQPDDFHISMNSLAAPFQIGNLAGGLFSYDYSDFHVFQHQDHKPKSKNSNNSGK